MTPNIQTNPVIHLPKLLLCKDRKRSLLGVLSRNVKIKPFWFNSEIPGCSHHVLLVSFNATWDPKQGNVGYVG